MARLLDQIIMQVIHTIRSEMFVDTAGVIVLDTQRKACQTFFLGDEALRGRDGLLELPVGYDDPLLALVREERSLVTRYDIEEDPRYTGVKEACLQRFSEMAATVAIPLVYQDRVTRVLALGRKKSGHFYLIWSYWGKGHGPKNHAVTAHRGARAGSTSCSRCSAAKKVPPPKTPIHPSGRPAQDSSERELVAAPFLGEVGEGAPL